MRGARLLQILLLLQNRGRMTSAVLAEELEVSQRTVLRDLDAMTEAGLPVIAHQGTGGGIELGFDYRSQMTALTTEEAEALALILNADIPALDVLGLKTAGKRAASKILESQAETVRQVMSETSAMFELNAPGLDHDDPRPAALARAVRGRNKVTLRARDGDRAEVHPTGLRFDGQSWVLDCEGGDVPQAEWGDIVISGLMF